MPTPAQMSLEAINYYSDLLIIQYNGLPKAEATIKALTNCSVCDQFFFQLQNAFNLATASGDQLTIIGKIVGVPRQIYGLDLVDTFMTFTSWVGDPASVGYNDWNNQIAGDKWASWLSTAVYTPTDFEMLALIQLKIMANTYFTSLGQIVPPLFNIFGNAITLIDNFNTSITWQFQQPYHNVGSVAAFLGNIVPKPMGVAITYQNI